MLSTFAVPSNVKQWAYAGFATLISGFSSGVVLIVADPSTFNLFQGGWRKLLATSAVFGVFNLFSYLKQHPLPDEPEAQGVTR